MSEQTEIETDENGTRWITARVPVATETDFCEMFAASRWDVRRVLEEFEPILDRGRGGKFYPTWAVLPALARVVKQPDRDSLRDEQLRKTKEEADKLALANAKARGELVETKFAIRLCQGIGVVIRNKILSSSMQDSEKDEILLDLNRAFEEGTVTQSLTGEIQQGSTATTSARLPA